MEVRLTTPGMLGALVVVLTIWILHSFLPALLVACVTAVASWPLYRRFAAPLRSRMPRGAISLVFTFLVSALVLAPLIFACWALLAKASTLLLEVVAADKKGIDVPRGWTASRSPEPGLPSIGGASLRIPERSGHGRSNAPTRRPSSGGFRASDSS